MKRNQIEIKFSTRNKESSKNEEIGRYFYNPDEKMKTVIQNFSSQKNINLSSANFSLNGKTLIKEDYERSISHFFSLLKKNLLNIQVDNIIQNSSNFNFTDSKNNSDIDKDINDEMNRYGLNNYMTNNNYIISNENKNNIQKINNNNPYDICQLSNIQNYSTNNNNNNGKKKQNKNKKNPTNNENGKDTSNTERKLIITPGKENGKNT